MTYRTKQIGIKRKMEIFRTPTDQQKQRAELKFGLERRLTVLVSAVASNHRWRHGRCVCDHGDDGGGDRGTFAFISAHSVFLLRLPIFY